MNRACLCAARVLALAGLAVSRARAEPELVRAFAFGSRQLDCPTFNDPATSYTIVYQGSPAALEYDAGRGWGYEVVDPGATTYGSRGGYGVFGPMDDSPNSRTVFADTCPEELYDSFIGAKDFLQTCNESVVGSRDEPCTAGGLDPEGLVFRADVPNGRYRFVAAVGDAQNLHAHTILVEDGGSGPPMNIGSSAVTLVRNYNQADYGTGVFARVGFDSFQPPPAAVGGFVNLDAEGRATAGPPSSPVLEVTQGYVRVHQLQGNSNPGAAGPGDPNGGDLVILELWRIESSFTAIESGSTWRYLQGLEEASSPDPAAWRQLGFDDSSWASGPTPFGYGDAPVATDLGALTPPMRNNYSTLYLRQTFQVSNAAGVNQLRATADYDDGFILWINGVEVLRINVDGLPGEPVSYDGFASSGHEAGLYEDYDLPDPSAYLLSGTNVACVQVFNVTITSSDLRFDLELFDPVAPDLSPPQVSGLVPAAGATVRSLIQVQVTFSEEVVGVDAADLLVSSTPAPVVTGDARGPYTFIFNAPPLGPVSLSWAAGHGITDRAGNPFAGGSWSYTLDPSAPPGDVVISELLAANRSGRRDEDGETSDWIELLNRGAEAVNLSGWSVTDDPDEPGKYVLPARSLGPQEYLLIFASGKDRAPASGELHAGFKLGTTGELVGLYNGEAPRQLISSFSPRYPPQRADISYGLDGSGNPAYFGTPTPGAPNATSVAFAGFVLEPVVTPARGIYDAPVQVALATGTPGAAIRYTLDGSEPGEANGLLYTGPITVAPGGGKGAVNLRAAAFRDGLLPSDVVTHTYVFPESVLLQTNNPAGFPALWNTQPADYEMDQRVVASHASYVREGLVSIPTLSLSADVDDLFGPTRGILSHPDREGVAWERPVSAELFFPDGRRQGFQVNCGLRVQGGSSTQNWKVLKVSMRLLFKGDYGPTKLEYKLFADSPAESFDTIVLDAHLNQTWNHPSHSQRVRAQYVRDQYVSDLQNAAGGFAPHDFFANLYVNGLHWGVYDIHERPDQSFASQYFGGDKENYDCLRHNPGGVVNGSAVAYNAMLSVARRDLAQDANYLALAEWVDIPNLTDYMLANIWAGNDDWAHQNWYATRFQAPGFPWRFHSWDAEHVLKDVAINRTGVNNAGSPAEVYSRLRANAEFRLLFADHVHRHFFNGGIYYVDPQSPEWNVEYPERNRPAARYMRWIDEVDPAIALESARWGDLRRPSQPYTRNSEWLAELNWQLTQYLPNRSARVLAQLRAAGLYPDVGAPVFSQHGGRIDLGFALAMNRPEGTEGTIHYTLDGTDPRVWGTGEVSPSAAVYSGPVTLWDHTHVKARILSGTTWSALTEATFTLADPRDAVRISEIMYNPAGGSPYEFIELRNTGSATVGFSGVRFTNGVDFAFPRGVTLRPGAYLVVVAAPDAFASRYPGVEPAGVYAGNLANEGERVTLENAAGEVIASVAYDDEGFWPLGADGFSWSLVALDTGADLDDPASWRASTQPGGSPGAPDPEPVHGGVLVNEVLARASEPLEDAVELLNITAAPADVSGWYLSDSRAGEASLKKYRIPPGMVIPAGGFAVFYESQFNPEPGAPGSFELAGSGGGVYLAAADPAGGLTGYITGAEFGPEEDGVSFGRHRTSAGVVFTALSERTFGADFPATVEEFRTGGGSPNSEPLFGPVVINEILYHPLEEAEEFVELFNPAAAPVALHDPRSGRGWRLDGVGFEFPPGAEIAARGYVLAVRIDPAVFRTLHGVPPEVPIHGPYGGELQNGGELLRLLAPDPEPEPGAAGTPFITIDEVRYDDEPPWPLTPDGQGPSLERILAAAYGNDPANWDASTRVWGTPGAENSVSGPGGNRRPQAIFMAIPQRGRAPLEVFFDASSSYDLDGTIVSYTWEFDDGSAPAGGVAAAHTFSAPRVYFVRLTVRDDEGEEDSAVVPVTVEEDTGGLQLPGDGNQDGAVDLADAVNLLRRLFGGLGSLPCDGASVSEGGNRTLFDLDGASGVNLTDAVVLLNFLFRQGPPPVLGTECLPIPGCPDVCGG